MKAPQHRRHGVLAWTFAALAGGLYAMAWLELPRARAKDSREFSSEETEQLRAGKLVVRPEQRNVAGMRLIGGMSWQLIDAPPSEVWRTMIDVRAYTHVLPAVVEARLIEVEGESRKLFIRHQVGFVEASYFVDAVYEAGEGRVRFRLDHDKPSSIREAWGEVRVTPYPEQRSVVSLVIMSDLGEGLGVALVRGKAHDWMLKVPEMVKRHVDKQRL
jgi:carbon monoxide dehydrogenase subunit G